MESLETIRNRVKDMLSDEIYDEGLDLIVLDDEGYEHGVILDTVGHADIVGGISSEYNIEVRTIYPNLWADTNIGHINLSDMIDDEDDWYTLEDVIGGLLWTDGKSQT